MVFIFENVRLIWIDVTDFTGDKAHQRTPTVGQLVPAEGVHLKSLGIKGNLLLGNALQVQKNNIYNAKQALTDFKTYISEKLSKNFRKLVKNKL